MTNPTLQSLRAEHSSKFPLAMNAVVANFAKESGLPLNIGTNYVNIVREEDADNEIQAIEVTEELEKTLNLLGVTMTPSVAEIDQMVRNNKSEEALRFPVTLQGGGFRYVGIAYETILNKTLSVWMDMNQLEQIHN